MTYGRAIWLEKLQVTACETYSYDEAKDKVTIAWYVSSPWGPRSGPATETEKLAIAQKLFEESCQ